MSKNNSNDITTEGGWSHNFGVINAVEAGKPLKNASQHKHSCDLMAPAPSRNSSTGSVGPTPKQNICGTTTGSRKACGINSKNLVKEKPTGGNCGAGKCGKTGTKLV